ncbi:MAG TPA: class I SAM-dependent methyltransferase [Phycisphaerales bacterium]|nr:class I SAM-dependent methyltransferase [Phycisphaerales bacterium]
MHPAHSTPSTPAFITAAYGHKYAAFLAPLLHSLRENSPEDQPAHGLVLYQDIPQREIDILKLAYPTFSFAHHDFPLRTQSSSGEPDASSGEDVMHTIPRKFHAWLEGAKRFPARPLVFLDCDTVLFRPLADALDNGADWDILFTWKDELFPINTGVMAARRGDVAAHVFAAILARIESTLADKQAFARAVGSSGAVDQHALRELIGFCNYDATFHRDITRNGDTRSIVFRGEPCRVFNETNCRAIDNNPDLRIIHYKTGWHPILLEGKEFTKNRPETACAQMFKHWHALEDRASAHTAATIVKHAARQHVERFLDIAGGYEERGILHSEMLAVCATSAALDADIIIESGRCRGQSTLVLAKFFENTRTKIISIELEKDENAAFAEQRLAPYKHVELLYGPAAAHLPTLLARYHDKKITLLLDGPKGLEAIALARTSMQQAPHIAATFIHDMRIDQPQRAAIAAEPFRTFFTDDPAYIREFGNLDEACLPRQGQPITIHTWRPYMKGNDKIPAYGPTLAVLLPRPARDANTALRGQLSPTSDIRNPTSDIPPDPTPNRLLRHQDWQDPRYTALRETFNTIYRDELKGTPHPSHARHPERIITHWSREWEYPFAVINSETKPGLKVVDLGCGGAPLIPYFVTRLGCHCAGVDLNLTASPHHTLRGFNRPPEHVFPQVTWKLRSMADTGLPSAQWDRVFCISVLEHVTEDLARETLREIKRLLKPDGRAVITTDVDGAHRTLTIDYRRIIALAQEAGLTLRGPTDFTTPDPTDRPGTYDVVGMVFQHRP